MTKLDDIINDHQEVEAPSTNDYTYIGEYHGPIPDDWSHKFKCTQLVVEVAAIVRDAEKEGLDNKSIASVLKGLLREVEQR
jgi:hypothetical protein